MRLRHRFPCMAGLVLGALTFTSIASKAQTVISNETLVTTTFVVNKTGSTAKCRELGCSARTSMFAPVSVTCPAAIGQTCTFHVFLDTKASAIENGGLGLSGTGFYRFLVDGAAPTIGPTDQNGDYLIERDVTIWTPAMLSRESYPASVVAGVTNATSNSHTIAVSVGCRDNNRLGGCEATAHWTTMRVDVFEP
jgi:hypothetical protein